MGAWGTARILPPSFLFFTLSCILCALMSSPIIVSVCAPIPPTPPPVPVCVRCGVLSAADRPHLGFLCVSARRSRRGGGPVQQRALLLREDARMSLSQGA